MLDVVWANQVDKRFDCKVVRTGPYNGVLTVHDGDKELHREGVRLSYGAIFGPDIADVQDWTDKSIAAVDKRIAL